MITQCQGTIYIDGWPANRVVADAVKLGLVKFPFRPTLTEEDRRAAQLRRQRECMRRLRNNEGRPVVADLEN